MPWYEITVYDILKHGALIMTTSAASQLTQRLLRPALSPYQCCIPADAAAAAHSAESIPGILEFFIHQHCIPVDVAAAAPSAQSSPCMVTMRMAIPHF
eukprot:scaffold85661_cov19-Tisochrysis_lutea.AAC.2